MNNEETIIDPQFTTESKSEEIKSVEQPKAVDSTGSPTEEMKNIGWGEKMAYAAGGAVVGAGVTFAGQAVAAPKTEMPEEKPADEAEAVATPAPEETTEEKPADEAVEPEVPEDEVTGVTVETNGTTVHVTGDAKVEIENGNVHVTSVNAEAASAETPQTPEPEQHAAPEPEDAIVATATGVRVAQVDDDASFSQAFADARAQVGPGGVFEWHGRVYGTYYKDEWDSMTAEQKHEYQASIDYNDVISDESVAQHHIDVAHHNAHNYSNTHHTSYDESEVSAKPDTMETGNDVTPDDGDVQVLEVGQTDLNQDGIPENAAVLEVNGHEVLIVDIDRDGIADAALCDVDNDGQPEIADLSDANMAMPEMSSGDAYMAQADAAPDYMNDANVGIYEA